MRVIVIGSGIVGLMSAYWLARDGHRITIVDRAPAVGAGASFANGGQLSYDYVAPFASPSVLAALPGWLLRPGSPVRFRPSLADGQLAWSLAFLAACTSRRSRITTERLLSLARFSRDALDALIAGEAISFGHRRNGKIVFYSSRRSFAAAARQHAMQAGLGSRQVLMSRDDCIGLEPALAAAAARICGAVYTPSEEVGDCLLLCRALQRLLAALPQPVEFRFGAPVAELIPSGSRIAAVRVGAELLEGDLYLLAAASDSRALAARVGVALPLYPIRGYSISPEIAAAAGAPDKSITDHARRIVYARLGGVLRVAGFADILPSAAPVDAGRIGTLAAATEELFPGVCRMADLAPWSGQRPATPTGVPIIGATKYANLLVNVGQGALGFTLAAGSGRLLADSIAGRRGTLAAADFGLPAQPSLAGALK